MRQFVNIVVAVNKAQGLPDLEKHLQHLLGTFFSVSVVRLLFFNAESEELLVSSAQMRQKGCVSFGLNRGIVGLCAKKQQIFHVLNVSHHHQVDSAADGLQSGNKTVAGDAAMLCGPLVVDHDKGACLVGVIELLEKVERKGSIAVDGKPGFSPQDQDLFQHILPVCAHAAWRTFVLQDQKRQLVGTPVTLAQMLAD